MPDKTITELPVLDINILSKEQYEALIESSEIDENALYITPEEEIKTLEWGNITGDIEDQQDLMDLLNSIQPNLTQENAGRGIIIENTSEVSPLISLDDLIFDCGTSTINVEV